MKPYAIKKCYICGKEIEIFHKARLLNDKITCSKNCSDELKRQKYRSKEGFMNCECPICHKKFHIKESQKNKSKNNYCSKECFYESKKYTMSGEKNHQFGLKGSKNPSWKSDRRISNYGYVLIRNIEHPFKDSDDFVREHRLVAEKYLLTENNSIEINGKRYLRKDYDVHHIDGNKQNNSVENLVVISRSKHMTIHSSKKAKKVKKYDLNNIFLEEYPSICEAARKNNISDSSIRNCLHNKARSAGGFIWKEVEKNERN